MCDSNFEEEKQRKSVVWQIAQNLSKNVDNVDLVQSYPHFIKRFDFTGKLSYAQSYPHYPPK